MLTKNNIIMKKFFFLGIFTCLTMASIAQITTPPDTSKKVSRNMIGVDATGLMGQFLNLNEYWYYYDPYIASYKRFMGSNALRFGIGGNYSNSDQTQDDTISMDRMYYDIRIGVGFEHYTFINKKCNLYFGADALYIHDYDEIYRNNEVYNTEYEERSHKLGISPLVGFQFRFWKRITFAVESSYDITYAQTKHTSKTIYNEGFNYDDAESKTELNGISTYFNRPISIRFQVHF